MSEVPRQPSHYSPTTHAGQQRKHRNIPWEYVAETLTDGTVKPTHKDNTFLFVKEFTYEDDPVGVVANIETGDVITIEWRQ